MIASSTQTNTRSEYGRFVIVTEGRTGSTWLRRMLDSHPLVVCHGEALGADGIAQMSLDTGVDPQSLHRERDDDVLAFLRSRVFSEGPGQASGFKALYRSLWREWPAALDWLRSDRDVRIIHLTRRNGVKRFMSEYMVGHMKGPHSLLESDSPSAVEPQVIDVDAMRARLNEVVRHTDTIRSTFSDRPVLELCYEDLCRDSGWQAAVCAYLGVPSATMLWPSRKVLADDLRLLIANLAEVREGLRGTPFEGDLDT